MNASESQTTHPQPCYLLEEVGAKPWGMKHALPRAIQYLPPNRKKRVLSPALSIYEYTGGKKGLKNSKDFY